MAAPRREMNRRDFNLSFLAIGAAAAARAAQQPAPLTVKAKKWKKQPEWTAYPTRALESLEGFKPGAKKTGLSPFGGRKDRKARATGFFRAEKIGNRWWLVDPAGCLTINAAVCSVGPGGSDRAQAALKEKYGTPERWAEAATALLRDNGFTGTAAWSSGKLLRGVRRPLPYSSTLGFLSGFGKEKKLTTRQPGHVGFVQDCPPIFHPEFPAFCDSYAKTVAATKDDPLLTGHCSDNELPAPTDLLDRSLTLDAANPNLAPGREAARAWLMKRKGAVDPAAINDADRDAFLEHVYDRYLELTCAALRKYDPNHLLMGPRLWGPSITSPGILRACGRHLDVIGINIYHQWEPEPKLVHMWQRESGKPFIVTEFYAKGEDSGLPNYTGAGWLVGTQNERGLFYQHFTLALLESKQCAGWHWLTYQDNDPENKKAELSNLDSNKGIVTIGFEPYKPLLDRMKALNENMYAIADYFDRV